MRPGGRDLEGAPCALLPADVSEIGMTIAYLKRALNDALRQVSDLKPKEVLQRRYERLQSYGRFTDTTER